MIENTENEIQFFNNIKYDERALFEQLIIIDIKKKYTTDSVYLSLVVP